MLKSDLEAQLFIDVHRRMMWISVISVIGLFPLCAKLFNGRLRQSQQTCGQDSLRWDEGIGFLGPGVCGGKRSESPASTFWNQLSRFLSSMDHLHCFWRLNTSKMLGQVPVYANPYYKPYSLRITDLKVHLSFFLFYVPEPEGWLRWVVIELSCYRAEWSFLLFCFCQDCAPWLYCIPVDPEWKGQYGNYGYHTGNRTRANGAIVGQVLTWPHTWSRSGPTSVQSHHYHAPNVTSTYFAIQIPTPSMTTAQISSFPSKQFGSKKHLEYVHNME